MVGGRAAIRAQRQAADAVKRREERRQGITPIPPMPGDPGRRGSPRLVIGLVTVVVVALVLLGVWSFQSDPTGTAAQTPGPSSTSAPATTTAAPPSSEPAPTPTPTPTPTGPVFAPVTVLNATTINGLAGDIGATLAAGGWQVLEPGAYSSADVAVTTVFYTAGDSTQEQAAASLRAQFPDIAGGPSERFFEIPGIPEPGLVVIATGSWQP